MKKIVAFLTVALLLVVFFTGCNTEAEKPVGGEKLKIVSTIFPSYDWVRQILGEQADAAELTLLLKNGVDPHSYQPTASDIITISTCDVFLHVGGESDGWVHDALKNTINKDMIVINLLDVLGNNAKTEEIKEGMEHDHDEDYDDHGEQEGALDEHVWLSLKNTQVFCEYIAEKLAEADPANADTYAANAKIYNGKLTKLDDDYQKAVGAGAYKTLLFGDRFPFRYLVDDYGLNYYAAFAGCSAETEVSFDTVIFLATKVDELGLKHVVIIESSDRALAKTIVKNTGDKSQNILVLDSLQSVTSAELSSGATYLSMMGKNLEVLKEALR